MKAVIFDLDGVITDTAKYHFIAWRNLAKGIDIEIDEVFNEQLKGISRLDSLERILEKGGKNSQYTKEEKNALAEKKNDEYVKLLDELTKEDVLPGIVELLKDLKQNNIKVAIASASKNAPMILEKLDVMSYIDAIADPANVQNSKPAPDIFVEALRLIDVKPEDAIGVEDSIAGVQAILDTPMKAVAIGVSEEISNSKAQLNVNSTKDLTMSLLNKI